MTQAISEATAPSRPRVLVLEDDLRLQQMLSTVLRLEDYDVEGVSTGSQALRSVAERRPDLLILDLLVPELSGYEVMRRLRDDPASSGIPILLVSSVQDLAREARSLGADDHLAKPFLVDELLNKVLPLLNRSQPAHQPAV